MLDNGVKERLKSLFFVVVVLGNLLVGYYFLYTYFPKLAFKCIFYEISGLRCPGCGITRMLVGFIGLNFWESIRFNFFVGITFPFIMSVVVYTCYLYVTEKKASKLFDIVCWLYVGLLLVWFIVRNIVGV